MENVKRYYCDECLYFYERDVHNPQTIVVYDQDLEYLGTYDSMDAFRIEHQRSN